MGIERVVDIADNGQHLSLLRGFLLVSRDRAEVGRVPLDDICALIVHGHGTTLSANLITALAQRNVFVVLCGSNHQRSPACGRYRATTRKARECGRR